MRLIIFAGSVILGALLVLLFMAGLLIGLSPTRALLAGFVAELFIIQVIWGWACVCRARQISHIDDGTY